MRAAGKRIGAQYPPSGGMIESLTTAVSILDRSFGAAARCKAAGALLCIVLASASAPAAGADMNKVVRHVFPQAEEGFDPQAAHDLYSGSVEQVIFETLLTYDYLARPAKLVPLTAVALPEVEDGGRTYTFRLKQGIHFTPDPAFKGKVRELVAEDYAYSLKRLIDPKVHSPWTWLIENKIVGLDEVAAKAKKTGKFDYDAKIPGLEVVDRYTLRIRLRQPDFDLPYVLAHEPTSAVAREVVEAYADAGGRVMSNPVGTGPYKLANWIRTSKIFLEANPDYRGFVWNFEAGDDPEDARLVAEMKGKKMPIVGRVEISIMEEDQSQLLAFESGDADLMNLEGPLAPKVLEGGKLKPELQRKGVKLSRFVDPEITYYYWNMMDPVVGGLSLEKIALRRAMAMAYDVDEEIRIVRNGQAVEAAYPIPPGIVGHDPNYHGIVKHDPATANALLDKFGYERGADGWRTLPDGKPLVIRYASRPDSRGRQEEEMWKRALDSVSIRMEGQKERFTDLLKLEKQCKLQMRTASWIADYPDGDNFMQLLYSKNIHQSNNGCTAIPEYDVRYEATQRMPAGPERDKLYREMTRIIEVYAPWRLGISRYRNMLVNPRILGYKKHPVLHSEWQYIDIDTSKQGG
jgi:ABC-type transport system substrate-binding protein